MREYVALARMRAIGVLLCHVLASPLFALDPRREVAQYALDTWGENEGLPGSYVYSILQTPDGYLWLGTRRGLARFDGVRFTVYDDRRPDQLRDSEVVALAEDDDGTLWIATHNGWLTRLRNGAFTSHSLEAHSGNTIRAMVKPRGGPLWIGTSTGLVAFDGHRFDTYTTEHGLPGDSVTALHADSHGTLWIGTTRGLASYAEGTFVDRTALHPGLEGTIRTIAGGGDEVWLDGVLEEDASVGGGTGQGLRR